VLEASSLAMVLGGLAGVICRRSRRESAR